GVADDAELQPGVSEPAQTLDRAADLLPPEVDRWPGPDGAHALEGLLSVGVGHTGAGRVTHEIRLTGLMLVVRSGVHGADTEIMSALRRGSVQRNAEGL